MTYFALQGPLGTQDIEPVNPSQFLNKALSGPPRGSCAALASALALIALSGCNKEQSTPNESEVVASETYEEFDKRRNDLEGSNGEFKGRGCTQDCGGHEAGYAWAESPTRRLRRQELELYRRL